jgi:hypothetical protein
MIFPLVFADALGDLEELNCKVYDLLRLVDRFLEEEAFL